jgi:hypothetical protein
MKITNSRKHALLKLIILNRAPVGEFDLSIFVKLYHPANGPIAHIGPWPPLF